MSFVVEPDAYDRFMGRYSGPLARLFADLAGVEAGQRILDVGCGPGALTSELVEWVGPGNVSAVDPSPPFVEAVRERHPGVDVHAAAAEALPFEDRTFDTTLAQLVVHFMDDPVAGLREMARVTTVDGIVAACVWDHAGDRGPLSLFWRAATDLDPEVEGESLRAGAREGHLGELFRSAGIRRVEERPLSVSVAHPTFEDWWEPFELGVGPAGGYVSDLDPARRTNVRERCRAMLPEPPFETTALAWATRGRV